MAAKKKPAKRKATRKGRATGPTRGGFKGGAARKVRAEYETAKREYHRLGKRLRELNS